QPQLPGDPSAAGINNSPLGTDLAGSAALSRGTIEIAWQGGMAFDGRTARFQTDVVGHRVEGEMEQTIHTPELEATFHERIEFNSPRPQQRPQLELLACRGEAQLENREIHDGNTMAIDRLQHVSDLTINQITGDILGEVKGEEPGRLFSWRFGSSPATALLP